MVVRRGALQAKPSLLQTATEVLVADPTASLGDVARAAGMGRTSLHKLYPTRHALLVALAKDGLDLLEQTYRDVELDVPGPEVASALKRLVTALIPLGPRLEFLLRERSLEVESELISRLDDLDAPVRTLVRRAQDEGVLVGDLPVDWVVASVNALVYTAWDLIASGRIAPVAAPGMVMRTLGTGILRSD